MAGNPYLALGTNNLPTQIAASQTSAGSGSAGNIVALNPSGVLDSTLFPPGFGEASTTLPATEALASGALCSVWSSAGVASVRNANATDATKVANCFVSAAFSSAATATIYFPGNIVTGASGLTIGAPVYLSTTAGVATSTAPSATGNLVMQVGYALSATTFIFIPQIIAVHI